MNEGAYHCAPELLELARGRTLVALIGAGGVGKTTVSAALALAAARSGRKTLCLTIDPARRLAQSLGLSLPAGTSEVELPPSAVGPGGASLTVMMLDAGKTFDELVTNHAPSKSVADKVLAHRVYRYLSRHLAGTQAFMAMEKVLSIERDGRFDLIVLDTPPSERALDFFDAPDRMREILDSPLTHVLGRAFAGGQRLGGGFVGKALGLASKNLGQVTGASFLSELGSFLATLSDLLGGFGERASAVRARLRREDVGYALVCGPSSLSALGALTLVDGLEGRKLPVEYLVQNRVPRRPVSFDVEPNETIVKTLETLGFDEGLRRALFLANEEQSREFERATSALLELGSAFERAGLTPAFGRIPESDDVVHDLSGLARLAASFRFDVALR